MERRSHQSTRRNRLRRWLGGDRRRDAKERLVRITVEDLDTIQCMGCKHGRHCLVRNDQVQVEDRVDRVGQGRSEQKLGELGKLGFRNRTERFEPSTVYACTVPVE